MEEKKDRILVADDKEKPDLVILDIMMAEMDGREVLEKVRRLLEKGEEQEQ